MNAEQQFSDDFDKQLNDITKTNVMVVGGTGVGKSSLINKVFGENLAPTGSGEPVTKGCKKYERENIPVVIFDTEGYEIFGDGIDNSNFQKVVMAEIERREKLDLKDQIHLYWYCLSASNHRITDYDISNIKDLRERHANLAIVITQCDNEEIGDNDKGVTSEAFRNILKKEGITNDIFETSTTLEDTLQLDDLLEWSADNLPHDKLRDGFIGAQLANLNLKDKQANKAIIAATAASAVAAGANPIPMSDSLALVPIQIALAARLAQVYGFSALDSSVMSLLKAQVLSLVGRQLAASLTKLIPFLGQVINAGVASAITGGLGHALKYAYRTAYEEMLKTGKQPDWTLIFSNLDILSYIKK